ncbi:MAG TPA: nitroreductase family deazaflavin-dependent oxidoreductase [Agromyces mariniharenae]|nr:nitroreductase family deazaflavin-dependent oxidoreductase [Agromyces mariniharenae]
MAAPRRPRKPPRWLLRASDPFALALAGRRWFPLWAVVHHRGRRSGTEYDTPIAIVPTVASEVVLIGLPWGATTEWARNVQAAGRAVLSWRGRIEVVDEPRIVGPEVATAMSKPPFRPVVRRFPAALVLTRR